MITTIIYIIIIIVILFGAMPFSITEAIINTMVDATNVVLQIVGAVINGLIQLVLGVVYGLVNFTIGGLYNTLSLYLPIDPWVNLEASSVMWVIQLPHLDFALAGYNTALSPMGTFINTLVNDPAISNVIGGVALGTLAILIIVLAIKSRKR